MNFEFPFAGILPKCIMHFEPCASSSVLQVIRYQRRQEGVYSYVLLEFLAALALKALPSGTLPANFRGSSRLSKEVIKNK